MLVALRSRRQIAPFTLYRPATLAEAMTARQAPGTSAFLAGGLDLIDWLKFGNPIDRLIRLDGVPGLSTITGGPALLRIGAMATHAAIAESPLIQAVLPDLSRLWHGVANPRVRFAGTIGGNVMAGRAEYDAVPALLALGAEAEIAIAEDAGKIGAASVGAAKAELAASAEVERIPLDRLGTFERPLLVSFVIPGPTALRLFTDRSLRPAVSVWLGLTVEAGRVRAVRVAAGLAHPRPICVTLPLDVPLTRLGGQAASIAAEVTGLMPPPLSDGRGSAGYRRRMIGVLTERTLVRAGERP
jgi:carbon-monoxide dehydrogenase medium subunit